MLSACPIFCGVWAFMHRECVHIRIGVLLRLSAAPIADLAPGAASFPSTLLYPLSRTTMNQPVRVVFVG